MEILGSVILFILFIFVYLVIVEIFVMLFRITGLTEEKARFQVISMLTNSGYTTRESELITNNKNRRKLARAVMMFGYAFTVTIVSTVVNIFLQFSNTLTVGAVGAIPVIAGVIVLSWVIKTNKQVKKIVDKFIKKVADKLVYDKNSNHITILDEHGKLVIAQVEMNILPEQIGTMPLGETKIRSEHKIIVMMKHTEKGQVVASRDTTFETGDTIIVMGDEHKIRNIFELPKPELKDFKKEKKNVS